MKEHSLVAKIKLGGVIMIYPSIDKLLNQVGSKYLLVNIVSKRAKEMDETSFYQMKENEYVSTKNIGRALEEVAKNLIHIDKFEKPTDDDTETTK